ncbi:MAG: hypothetical protein J6A57_05785 [Ruminococcus sp.]|nr:hypothetical protein [Ruminococcus sp.]MBQ9139828.1 hypothetical protein [Ruminococcus sp.]
MSNIKYNEEQEAFELPYKLWDDTVTIRFYVEDEADIMNNIKDIAEKLSKLDGSRKQIAELIINDGYCECDDIDAFAKALVISNPYVDIDDGDIIVCFDVETDEGYLNIELFEDDFEITGWAN